MKYFGVLAFILSLVCLGKMNELDKLKKKIRKLEKWNGNAFATINEERDGMISMSKLIEELVGKNCLFVRDDSIDIEGVVLAVDEEWVKVEIKKLSKKQSEKELQLIRIESIEEIRQISE